ncbi:hypothetical protein GCM10010341_50050 [Streptomyces noursei]|nr:hypothetical protein GCM10010341_50050 [Streptomyces noursei]
MGKFAVGLTKPSPGGQGTEAQAAWLLYPTEGTSGRNDRFGYKYGNGRLLCWMACALVVAPGRRAVAC